MKKITLLFAFIFIGGMIYGQNSIQSSNSPGEIIVNGPAGTATQDMNLSNLLAPVVITHNNSQDIEPVTGVLCSGGGIATDNSFFREFDLVNDFDISVDLTVTAAEFGIETITTATGTFPIVANIYSSDAAFPGGTLTLLGTGTYDAVDTDAGTVVSIPVNAIVPAGSIMVLEIAILEDGTSIFPGANTQGETAPSWIQAVDCGIETPVTYGEIGFPDVALVMNVVGDTQDELNDDPETAATLIVGEVFEDNPRIADNTEATATAIDDPSCGNFTEADLWYKFTVPDSGSVSVESREDDGSITDTGLSIYEGTPGALVEVVCNDDGGVGLFSLAEVEGRTPGEVLYARVWEWNGGSLGTFQMSAYDTPPPVNDDPEGAIALMVGSVFTDFPVTATNVSATDTAIDDPSCGNYGGADVWFTVQVPSTGQLVIETDTAEGITDTGMSIYSGEIGALVEIDCDDDDGNGLFSLNDLVDQEGGSTLYIRVWEWGGGGFGLFQIAAYSDCAVNGAAIEITETSETEITICTTDGVPDPINVTIVGDPIGTNSGWVITDQATGEILGLPMAPPFDLDGVEPGVCEIWYIRYEDGLTGLDMGANVADLDGCFDFSNPIAVTRADDGTVCPPTNDDCENAIALECDTTVVGSTVLANDSGSNPAPDVFYTYTGTGNESITLSLCDGGTDYDSFLRVFDDECNLVNEIAANDDSCGLQSELTFISDGVTTYTIMVEGFGSNSGNYSLAVTCEALPDCLQPIDLTAANITEVSADLSWTDLNNPNAISYDVEWGLQGFAIGTGTVEAGVANPFTLGGLTANTAYDFYVTANCTEDESSEISGPATFTTNPEQAPPGECEYTLQMFDSFGDGWNGALLNVFRNGQVVLFEVSLDDDPANDGTTGSLQFEINPGDDITTELVDGGGFPGEISYDIIALAGGVVGSGDANNNIESGTITGNCTLSVDDNTLEGFNFYPNPAQDVITLDARTAIEDVTIFNLLGQKVLQQKVDGVSNYQLNVSAMAKGAYLMQVTANGKVGVYRVLKM